MAKKGQTFQKYALEMKWVLQEEKGPPSRKSLLVNHKKVYQLMKKLETRSVTRKKRRFFGTQASVASPSRFEHQFQENTPLSKLERILCTSGLESGAITWRFVYLSAIQDLYNNKIVVWKLIGTTWHPRKPFQT